MTRNVRIRTAFAGLSITAVAAALLAIAAPDQALAQVGDINSASGSNATADSGSVSGASSDQSQAQQANNYGIGNSQSDSASNSVASSGSVSDSASSSDQGQSQGQSLSNQLGQTASNSQGVAVSNTFNTTTRKVTEFRTNAAVPLAASSSFSSDYCGGTTSAGASAAPLGISIGAASPTFDNSCRYLRVAEKAGMLGANYHNMGQEDMSGRAMSLMAWAVCMAGPQQDRLNRGGSNANVTMEACIRLGLLGSEASPASPPPARAPDPAITQPSGQPTPEAVERYKTPRGDLQFDNRPVIQAVPIAAATLP